MPAAVAHRPPTSRCRRATLLVAVLLGATATGCPGVGDAATHPPPEVYAEPSEFQGQWRGEVGDVSGTLRIEPMGENRYYANFRGDSRPVRYILSLDQVQSPVEGDATAPSNLSLFTWQDGRGGRGHGWLLINREETALTGTFGRGQARTGMGVWTFIREGEPPGNAGS